MPWVHTPRHKSEYTKDASKVQRAVEKFTCPPIPVRNSTTLTNISDHATLTRSLETNAYINFFKFNVAIN